MCIAIVCENQPCDRSASLAFIHSPHGTRLPKISKLAVDSSASQRQMYSKQLGFEGEDILLLSGLRSDHVVYL
jgi:hypothetical protein